MSKTNCLITWELPTSRRATRKAKYEYQVSNLVPLKSEGLRRKGGKQEGVGSMWEGKGIFKQEPKSEWE